MPSSPRNPWIKSTLLVVAGLVAGMGVMFLLNPNNREREGQGPASGAAPAAAPSPAVVPPVDAPPRPDEVLRDAASVLSDAIAIPDRDRRAESLRHLASRLVHEDVMKALALGAKIPDANDRIDFMRALFAEWALKEPKAALEYARAHFSPGLLQGEVIDAAIEKWAGTNPRDALKWAEASLSGPVKEQAVIAAAQGWARNDPAAAAAWFLSTGSTSQPLLNAIVTTWTDLNPRAAAAWAEMLTDPENRVIAHVSLASEWARQNPAEAAAYFNGKLEGREGMDIASALVNSWGASEPAAAAEWISSMPPGALQQQASGMLATIWAASDINKAVKWSEGISDPKIKAQVINHLAMTWGAIDPGKAIGWIATLPPGEERDGAMNGAFDSWAATDTPGLEKWIATEPAGARSDVARESLASVQIDRDPAAAMQTTMEVNQAVLRHDLLRKYFRRWQAQDAGAAKSWLDGAAPEVQAVLRTTSK